MVDRQAAWNSTALHATQSDRLVTVVNSLFPQPTFSTEERNYTIHFAWSPDGRALLLDYYQKDAVKIFHVSSNGIVTVAVDSWSPTWAPTGETMAAVSSAGLFRTTLDGHHHQLLSHRAAQAPAWSPDGRRIAFLATPDASNGRTDTGFDLWVLDEWGTQELLLATDCVAFAWAPDGKQLAYVTGEEQSAAPLLYLWTHKPGEKALLLAEISKPTIGWKPLP